MPKFTSRPPRPAVRLSFVSESAHVLRLEPHRIFKFARRRREHQDSSSGGSCRQGYKHSIFQFSRRLPLNKGRQAIFDLIVLASGVNCASARLYRSTVATCGRL